MKYKELESTHSAFKFSHQVQVSNSGSVTSLKWVNFSRLQCLHLKIKIGLKDRWSENEL